MTKCEGCGRMFARGEVLPVVTKDDGVLMLCAECVQEEWGSVDKSYQNSVDIPP
jgi:hypothetical protein